MTDTLYCDRRGRRRGPTTAEKVLMKAAKDERTARAIEAAHEARRTFSDPVGEALDNDDFPEMHEALRLFPADDTADAFKDAAVAFWMNPFHRHMGVQASDFRQQVIQSLALTAVNRRLRLVRSRPRYLANQAAFGWGSPPVPSEPEGGWRARVRAPIPAGFAWEDNAASDGKWG